VQIHELIARGAAAARRRNGWTQEQAANAFRSHGLRAWRKGTVGQLEAGLRKPRLNELLLMARALDVTLDQLIPGGDEERVELGEDAVVSPRWIREMLTGAFYRGDRPVAELPYERFPPDDVTAAMRRRSPAAEERDAPFVEAVLELAEQNDIKIMARDLLAIYSRASDAERHAAERLEVPVLHLKLCARFFAARGSWDYPDFDSERDRRIGNIDELEPRSRQARRGLVTREMLAELRAFIDEVPARQKETGRAGARI
jgi:transcriptional regulator with XRE-family HTH domain